MRPALVLVTFIVVGVSTYARGSMLTQSTAGHIVRERVIRFVLTRAFDPKQYYYTAR